MNAQWNQEAITKLSAIADSTKKAAEVADKASRLAKTALWILAALLLIALACIAGLIRRERPTQVISHVWQEASSAVVAPKIEALEAKCFVASTAFKVGSDADCCIDNLCSSTKKCEWKLDDFAASARVEDKIESYLSQARLAYVIGGHDGVPVNRNALTSNRLDSNIELAILRANAVQAALFSILEIPMVPMALSHPPTTCGRELSDYQRRQPRIVLLLHKSMADEITEAR